MSRAASPNMRERHDGAAMAGVTEIRCAMPPVSQRKGTSGILPQKLAQAGGDIDCPERLEMA